MWYVNFNHKDKHNGRTKYKKGIATLFEIKRNRWLKWNNCYVSPPSKWSLYYFTTHIIAHLYLSVPPTNWVVLHLILASLIVDFSKTTSQLIWVDCKKHSLSSTYFTTGLLTFEKIVDSKIHLNGWLPSNFSSINSFVHNIKIFKRLKGSIHFH